MAAKGKRKAKRSGKARAKTSTGGKSIANHSFGGRQFNCYGKTVRAGKGTKRIPRIFCARNK